jgi:dihydroneopterin aldolase/2-amino-4-hydroxy-6-hydroxymethyldihydropteridine diphosphokinase
MDRITLSGIRAYGRHGADAGERDRPQPFDVDLVVEIDLEAARRSDDLADTLDYARLHERLIDVVAGTSYALIERLAEELVSAALDDPRVFRAEVTVAKPGILAGATPSVTIARVRRHRAYIGLGANAGDDPIAGVGRALAALSELGTVVRRSSLYRTRAWGNSDQPDFINAVAALETELTPGELLTALKAIEVRHGRTPDRVRWGPRIIDLDILTYDDVDIDQPGLRVPHRDLRERAFVLVPLAEIDPAYRSLLDALAASELSGVERVAQLPPA